MIVEVFNTYNRFIRSVKLEKSLVGISREQKCWIKATACPGWGCLVHEQRVGQALCRRGWQEPGCALGTCGRGLGGLKPCRLSWGISEQLRVVF